MKSLVLFLALTVLFVSSAFSQYQSKSIYAEIPNAKVTFSGLRAFKPVLTGILYRGGGPGGTIPIKKNQLEALCKQGFSAAGYLYPNGMSAPIQMNCTNLNESNTENQIQYQVYGFRSRNDRYQAMKSIYDIIQNKKGPMFMHCWNGWHASGEIAAIALMQFCKWTGAEAGEYWKASIGDKGNISKYRSIYETHIGGFKPFEDLKISDAEQNKICPEK